MEFLLCVLGMVMFLEGVPYAAFPEKMKLWMRKMIDMPEASLRRIGFVLMVSGFILVYVGKR